MIIKIFMAWHLCFIDSYHPDEETNHWKCLGWESLIQDFLACHKTTYPYTTLGPYISVICDKFLAPGPISMDITMRVWFFFFRRYNSIQCHYLAQTHRKQFKSGEGQFFANPKTSWQAWLDLAQWFCRRRFLKIFSVFLLFWYYLPFHLNKLESPLPKDDLW
jgi:hypothetical protein